MLRQFKKYIEKEFPLLRESSVLLAVSGGVDSMVMLHLFKLADLNFTVAHCNFQLRDKESHEDENFVKAVSKKSGIKIHTRKFETKKYAALHHLSKQMAARQLRYEWFIGLSEKYGYDFIATAHHRTDVAETLIINQLRGTGIAGMHGILPANGKIIRPLLFAGREEILQYAQQQKLSWRDDSSNSSDSYTRNKIRLKVLPVFKELNPSFEKVFTDNAQHFYDAEMLLHGFLNAVKKQLITADKNNIYLNVTQLNSFENTRALLYFLLRDYGFKNSITTAIYESFNKRSSTGTGKKFLSETHLLIKNRDQLIITKLPDQTQIKHDHYEILSDDDGLIGDGFSIKIKRIALSKSKKIDFAKTQHVAYFDAAKINFPLQLRKWKNGDCFYPYGMKGKRKKLSDYFIDEKVSLHDKERTWLVLSGGEICWVAGMRTDERFKITPQTQTVLAFTFTNTNY